MVEVARPLFAGEPVVLWIDQESIRKSVSVADLREQHLSCTGRTEQLPLCLCLLAALYACAGAALFLCWVLAAAVVARRLLPKSFGKIQNKTE